MVELPGPPPVPLHRNRPFALFWVAQVLSNTGTQVSELAVPLTAVLVLAAGPAEMGVLAAVEALPSLVLGLLVGVLVDRVRRGRLLVWSNVGQAVLIGTIPIAAGFGALTLVQLYAVTFLVGGLALAYGLAHTAFVPVLVSDPRQLTAANSSVALSDSVTAVGGPGLGGLLVHLLTAPVAVAVDAVSFLVAAVLQLGGRRLDPRPPPSTVRIGGSLREGMAAFAGNRGVVALTLAKGVPDFFHWGVLALYVLYAVRELQLSAATIGLIAMAAALGPVLAGVVAEPVSRRFGTSWPSVVAAVLLGGNLLVPLAAGPGWLVVTMVAAGQFLLGLGVVYLVIVRATMLQQAVQPHLLGRVGAVIRLVEWGPGPIGGIVGGMLGEALGLRTGLVVLGVGGLLGVPWVLLAAVRGDTRTIRGA